MELLLIRHALPVRRELPAGAADPELSDAGHAQARRLADYLSDERLDALYTSPMRRAIETAAPIGAVHGLVPVVDEDVAEWDRDSSAYVPVEELKATGDPRWRALLDGVWEGDEHPEKFVDRVCRALDRIVAEHAGARVAVVCHGGVINAYLARVIGLTGPVTAFFYPNYTSIHRVAAARSGERSIVTVNETAHLRGSGLPVGLFQRGES
jgi:broad specificity phosphatase PhoE